MKIPKKLIFQKIWKLPTWLFAIFLVIAVIGNLLLLTFFVLPYFSTPKADSAMQKIAKHADEIIASCEGKTKEFCYAKIFYDITTKKSIEYSIALLDEVERKDSEARGCHFIAHNISIAETMKDIDHWQEVLGKVPVGACSGGFMHGVIEAKSTNDPTFDINAETIPKICQIVKERTKSGENDANCSHIMGHLTMVATLGDVKKSVDMCSSLPEWMQYECFSGVFMEYETRDNLIAHKVMDQRIPWNPQTSAAQIKICQQYEGVPAKACWREASHMFAFISRNDPKATYTYCAQAYRYEDTLDCYRHAVGIMAVSANTNVDQIINFCSPYEKGSDEFRLCYMNAVGSMVMSSVHFVDRAVALCSSLSGMDTKECYDTLGKRLIPKTTKEDREELCKQVPDYFRSSCINGS